MAKAFKRTRIIGVSAVVLLAGMLAGTILITPVGAHITTFKHLKKHFYTKQAADARFLDASEVKTQVLPEFPEIYAANVGSNGALLGSVPSGVTSRRLNPGDYEVIFPRQVTGCAISASLTNNHGTFFLFGEIEAAPSPFNPNGVRVATAASNGTLADRGFGVQMICP
jgi:hypothetical protein